MIPYHKQSVNVVNVSLMQTNDNDESISKRILSLLEHILYSFGCHDLYMVFYLQCFHLCLRYFGISQDLGIVLWMFITISR
jgi:hypothetical protein